jgi:hypothetical protein
METINNLTIDEQNKIKNALYNNDHTTIYITKTDAGSQYFWGIHHDEGTTGIGGIASNIASALRSALPHCTNDYAVIATIKISHFTDEDYDCADFTPMPKPKRAQIIVTNCNNYTYDRCRQIANALIERAK